VEDINYDLIVRNLIPNPADSKTSVEIGEKMETGN
jgi:hypothetical protein